MNPGAAMTREKKSTGKRLTDKEREKIRKQREKMLRQKKKRQ
jgi:hypothetical protein